MTDDQLDERLRHLLSTRADQVEPTLSGPQLRSLAGRSTPTFVRFAAPVLAGAAVIALAVSTQVFAGHDGHAPRPQPPGDAPITQTTAPPTTPLGPPRSAPPLAPAATPIRSGAATPSLHRPPPGSATAPEPPGSTSPSGSAPSVPARSVPTTSVPTMAPTLTRGPTGAATSRPGQAGPTRP